MNLNERIAYIIENNSINPNISDTDFAKSIGTYATKISEIRSGKVKSLDPKLALEISNIYKYSFKWILTGIEPKEDELISATEPVDVFIELLRYYSYTIKKILDQNSESLNFKEQIELILFIFSEDFRDVKADKNTIYDIKCKFENIKELSNFEKRVLKILKFMKNVK